MKNRKLIPLLVYVVALTLLLFPLLHRVSREDRQIPPLWLALLALAVGLSWLMRLESGAVSAFIYFQF